MSAALTLAGQGRTTGNSSSSNNSNTTSIATSSDSNSDTTNHSNNVKSNGAGSSGSRFIPQWLASHLSSNEFTITALCKALLNACVGSNNINHNDDDDGDAINPFGSSVSTTPLSALFVIAIYAALMLCYCTEWELFPGSSSNGAVTALGSSGGVLAVPRSRLSMQYGNRERGGGNSDNNDDDGGTTAPTATATATAGVPTPSQSSSPEPVAYDRSPLWDRNPTEPPPSLSDTDLAAMAAEDVRCAAAVIGVGGTHTNSKNKNFIADIVSAASGGGSGGTSNGHSIGGVSVKNVVNAAAAARAGCFDYTTTIAKASSSSATVTGRGDNNNASSNSNSSGTTFSVTAVTTRRVVVARPLPQLRMPLSLHHQRLHMYTLYAAQREHRISQLQRAHLFYAEETRGAYPHLPSFKPHSHSQQQHQQQQRETSSTSTSAAAATAAAGDRDGKSAAISSGADNGGDGGGGGASSPDDNSRAKQRHQQRKRQKWGGDIRPNTVLFRGNILKNEIRQTRFATLVQRTYMRAVRHSDAMRMESLHYLRLFALTVPELADAWKGDDYCRWPGVLCTRVRIPLHKLLDHRNTALGHFAAAALSRMPPHKQEEIEQRFSRLLALGEQLNTGGLVRDESSGFAQLVYTSVTDDVRASHLLGRVSQRHSKQQEQSGGGGGVTAPHPHSDPFHVNTPYVARLVHHQHTAADTAEAAAASEQQSSALLARAAALWWLLADNATGDGQPCPLWRRTVWAEYDVRSLRVTGGARRPRSWLPPPLLSHPRLTPYAQQAFLEAHSFPYENPSLVSASQLPRVFLGVIEGVINPVYVAKVRRGSSAARGGTTNDGLGNYDKGFVNPVAATSSQPSLQSRYGGLAFDEKAGFLGGDGGGDVGMKKTMTRTTSEEKQHTQTQSYDNVDGGAAAVALAELTQAAADASLREQYEAMANSGFTVTAGIGRGASSSFSKTTARQRQKQKRQNGGGFSDGDKSDLDTISVTVFSLNLRDLGLIGALPRRSQVVGENGDCDGWGDGDDCGTGEGRLGEFENAHRRNRNRNRPRHVCSSNSRSCRRGGGGDAAGNSNGSDGDHDDDHDDDEVRQFLWYPPASIARGPSPLFPAELTTAPPLEYWYTNDNANVNAVNSVDPDTPNDETSTTTHGRRKRETTTTAAMEPPLEPLWPYAPPEVNSNSNKRQGNGRRRSTFAPDTLRRWLASPNAFAAEGGAAAAAHARGKGNSDENEGGATASSSKRQQKKENQKLPSMRHSILRRKRAQVYDATGGDSGGDSYSDSRFSSLWTEAFEQNGVALRRRLESAASAAGVRLDWPHILQAEHARRRWAAEEDDLQELRAAVMRHRTRHNNSKGGNGEGVGGNSDGRKYIIGPRAPAYWAAEESIRSLLALRATVPAAGLSSISPSSSSSVSVVASDLVVALRRALLPLEFHGAATNHHDLKEYFAFAASLGYFVGDGTRPPHGLGSEAHNGGATTTASGGGAYSGQDKKAGVMKRLWLGLNGDVAASPTGTSADRQAMSIRYLFARNAPMETRLRRWNSVVRADRYGYFTASRVARPLAHVDDDAIFGNFEARLVPLVALDVSRNPGMGGYVRPRLFRFPLLRRLDVSETTIMFRIASQAYRDSVSAASLDVEGGGAAADDNDDDDDDDAARINSGGRRRNNNDDGYRCSDGDYEDGYDPAVAAGSNSRPPRYGNYVPPWVVTAATEAAAAGRPPFLRTNVLNSDALLSVAGDSVRIVNDHGVTRWPGYYSLHMGTFNDISNSGGGGVPEVGEGPPPRGWGRQQHSHYPPQCGRPPAPQTTVEIASYPLNMLGRIPSHQKYLLAPAVASLNNSRHNENDDDTFAGSGGEWVSTAILAANTGDLRLTLDAVAELGEQGWLGQLSSTLRTVATPQGLRALFSGGDGPSASSEEEEEEEEAEAVEGKEAEPPL